MPYEKSPDLFELVKSLSGAEKRHFTLFANRGFADEENNYLKLFSAIEQQDTYDEKEIIKKFEKEKFVKQLHRTKNYLYDLILTSLSFFHVYKDTNAELIQKTRHIKILIQKGLYKQAAKQIKQTKKQALLHEQYEVFITVNRQEMIMLNNGIYPKNADRYYDKLLELEKEASETIQLESKYKAVNYKVGSGLKQAGVARNKEAVKKINELISDKFFKDEKLATTFLCKVCLYDTLSFAEMGKSNHEKAYHYNEELIKLIETTPNRIKENPRGYVIALNNQIVICRMAGRTKEMLKAVRKMRSFRTQYSNRIPRITQVEIFNSLYQNELAAYLESGQFKSGLRIVPKLKKGLKQYDEQIRLWDKMNFYYRLCYLYFGLENYAEAMNWINRALNEWLPDYELNLYTTLRLLNIIIHFEMGNFNYLEYAIKSTYRFLLKKERLYGFEKALLKFFKTLTTTADPIEGLKELRHAVLSLSKDEYERALFEYFDFISWIDSKIEKRPFAEIVREKQTETSTGYLSATR